MKVSRLSMAFSLSLAGQRRPTSRQGSVPKPRIRTCDRRHRCRIIFARPIHDIGPVRAACHRGRRCARRANRDDDKPACASCLANRTVQLWRIRERFASLAHSLKLHAALVGLGTSPAAKRRATISTRPFKTSVSTANSALILPSLSKAFD